MVYVLLWHQLGTSVPQGVSISRLLKIALLLAVAFRVPLAAPRVGADNDMVRYMYDGRLQRLGFNPFEVVPADPAVAWTHTDETRKMPSIRARTPYPAAAQLFFRLVVTIRETSRAMKWALSFAICSPIWVLVKWLQETNRSPWLALLYAWNPLVILEVAHSGHIDALGALWIAVVRMDAEHRAGRCEPRSVRPRGRDQAAADRAGAALLETHPLRGRRCRRGVVLAALYFPFRSAGMLPLGAVPNVVAFIRFNGPLSSGWRRPSHRKRPPRSRCLPALPSRRGCGSGATLATRRRGRGRWRCRWPRRRSSIRGTALLHAVPVHPRDAAPRRLDLLGDAGLHRLVLSKLGHRWFVPAPVVWVEFAVVLMVLVGLTVLKGAEAPSAPT